MKKALTPRQNEVLATLTRRKAELVATVTREHWERGEPYYLDARCAARRGLVRKFEACNREAVAVSTNGAREKCPSCKAKPGAPHSAGCTGGNHQLALKP